MINKKETNLNILHEKELEKSKTEEKREKYTEKLRESYEIKEKVIKGVRDIISGDTFDGNNVKIIDNKKKIEPEKEKTAEDYEKIITEDRNQGKNDKEIHESYTKAIGIYEKEGDFFSAAEFTERIYGKDDNRTKGAWLKAAQVEKEEDNAKIVIPAEKQSDDIKKNIDQTIKEKAKRKKKEKVTMAKPSRILDTESVGKKSEKKKPKLEEPEEEILPEELELDIREARKKKEGEVLKSEEPEATPEKPKEQILDDIRKEFARLDLDAEKYVKAQKRLGIIKTKEDFEKYQKTKETYLDKLKTIREEMYSKISKDGSKSAKERMNEIVKETIIREANKLYDQKMDLKLEAKGDASKIEKIKNFASKIVEKYRKMPLRKKLLLSAGLMAGGVVAGVAGGATGAALATGLVAGKWLQRSLGGAATAVGLEGLIKRSQEKKIEKKTLAELTERLKESIENKDKKLDEKLFELEGGKKKQKYWRYALAGTIGVLIASGWTGKALANVIPDGWSDWTKDKLGLKGLETEVEEAQRPKEMQPEKLAQAEALEPREMDPEKLAQAEALEPREMQPEKLAQAEALSYIETVKKGDSVWKLAERQLAEHYGEKFTELDEAKKTYLIDAIKDKVAANPSEFGLEDVDKLKVGQEIDFSSAFEDSDKIFEKVDALKQAALENIEKNNKILEEWVKEHPKEQLTSEKVDQILSGGKIKEIAEQFSPEKQEELYKNFLKGKGFDKILSAGDLPEGSPSGRDFIATIKIDNDPINVEFKNSGLNNATATFKWHGHEHILEGDKINPDSIREIIRDFSIYEKRAMKILGLSIEQYDQFDELNVNKLLEGDYKIRELKGHDKFIKYINSSIEVHGLKGKEYLNKMTIGGFLKMFG